MVSCPAVPKSGPHAKCICFRSKGPHPHRGQGGTHGIRAAGDGGKQPLLEFRADISILAEFVSRLSFTSLDFACELDPVVNSRSQSQAKHNNLALAHP